MARHIRRIDRYDLAGIVLYAILALQLARLFWAVVTPVGLLGDWRLRELAVPVSREAMLDGFDPFFRLSAMPSTSNEFPSRFRLFGTRMTGADGQGAAILAGPDGFQNTVATGEAVAAGFILKTVGSDFVVLTRAGHDQKVYMAGNTSGSSDAEAQSDDGRSTPVVALTIDQLKSGIAMMPRTAGDSVSGVIVHPRGSGVVFRQAGLKDGDIVTEISGRPVASTADFDRIAANFALGGGMPIMIERDHKPVSLDFTIAPAAK